MMLAKDFINDIVYQGINQVMPSSLMGNRAVLGALNLAVGDIYAFDGRYWNFMKDIIRLKAGTATCVESEVPVISISEACIDNCEPTIHTFKRIKETPQYEGQWIAYKKYEKEIYISGRSAGAVIEYVHWFNEIKMEDEIPLPRAFYGALYNLTLSYIYPTYGQMAENKEVSVYEKARAQLTALQRTDDEQISSIDLHI